MGFQFRDNFCIHRHSCQYDVSVYNNKSEEINYTSRGVGEEEEEEDCVQTDWQKEILGMKFLSLIQGPQKQIGISITNVYLVIATSVSLVSNVWHQAAQTLPLSFVCCL